jgi:hypothetical protein
MMGHNTLDDKARRLIAGADTIFVASRSRSDIDDLGGLDVSHRGGRPGFVEVQSDTLVKADLLHGTASQFYRLHT